MYCKYCGTSIADDALFCSACGKELKETTGTPNSSSQTSLLKNQFDPIPVIIVKPKSPSIAAVWELILPGAGHLYAKSISRGWGILIGTIAASILVWGLISVAVVYQYDCQFGESGQPSILTSTPDQCTAQGGMPSNYAIPDYSTSNVIEVLVIISELVWIVIRMIMAVDTANKYNKSLISKQNPILVSQTTAPPDK